jgi:hypothetical protein
MAPSRLGERVRQALAAALALSDANHDAVTAALFESLAQPDRWGEDDPAFAQELERRLERVERSEVAALDGDEVELEVRASLRRR